MAQSIDEEMEAMLLSEGNEGKRMEEMEAQIAGLMQQVRQLAERQAPEVSVISATMHECIAQIRKLGGRTRKAEPKKSLKNMGAEFRQIDEVCNRLESGACKIEQLGEELSNLKRVDLDQLGKKLSETLEQAQYDDRAMRKLSQLLAVDSTEVVASVQRILESATGNSRIEEPRTGVEDLEITNVGLFQSHNATQPADKSSPSFADALRRVHTGEVPRNVELSEFDPIAAARGNHPDESTAPLRRNILPQRRVIPTLQRKQPVREPPRLPGFPSTTSRQNSQGRNEILNSETGLTKVMCSAFTAMALPDVPVFDNAQGKGFDKFLRSFMIKYGGLSLGDDTLIHLLCSKLAGQPRVVVETLPLEVREGTFQEFVAGLKAKFKENESANRMEAYISLKNILYSGSISKYCVRLEQLTRAAYPESSERELSILRTGELIAQLTDWPEYVQLFTEVEQTPGEEAYEKLKALAQRIERSREVALLLKQEATNKPKRFPRGQQMTQGREHMSPTKAEKEYQEHARPENTDQNMQQNGSKKRELLCHNCKKPGHFRRDCKEVPKPQHTAGRPKDVPERGRGKSATSVHGAGSFSAVLRHWACTTVAKKNASDLVGTQTLETVKNLGLQREALMDSGSQISIMPLELLLTAQEKGFDIDRDVEEIPQREYPPVYDASGNLMNFKGAIRLTVELRNGPRCRAAFFVSKGGDRMIVLGTNILHAFGYSVSRRDQPCKGGRKRPNHQRNDGPRDKRVRKPDKTGEWRQAKVAATHEHTRVQNEKARQRMKLGYDRNNKVNERPLTLGDRVYIVVSID